jgi:uncharacterized protein (DUF849 family)
MTPEEIAADCDRCMALRQRPPGVASAGVHPADLTTIILELPAGTVWCAGGIGPAQPPAATLGLLFGDGVHIGLEDKLRLPKDRRRPTSTLSSGS